jgi:hypothetical protein
MSREWKAGDLALVDYGPDVELMFRAAGGGWDSPTTWADDVDVVSVRPVVVIDPEDREQVERLILACPTEWMFQQDEQTVAECTGLMAAALRSLLTPPRPDEPTGLGAVVEDDKGMTWVRNPETADDSVPWINREGKFGSWPKITAVRVLSEGVTP